MPPLAAKINSQTRLSKERHRRSSLGLPVLMSEFLRRRWVQIWFKTTEILLTTNNQGLTQTTRDLLTLLAQTFPPWEMPNNSRYSWKPLLPQSRWPLPQLIQSVADRLIAAHSVVSTNTPRNHRKRTRNSGRVARDSPWLTWQTVKINSLALSSAVRTSHSRKTTSQHRLSI